MTHRKRWNPIPSVLYGIAFGILAGGLMIWATDQDDRWQDQASRNNAPPGAFFRVY